MLSLIDRRTILKSAVVGGLGLVLPGSGVAAPASRLTVTPVDEDLAVISGAGTNVTAARSSDGIAMVDGGLAEHSKALLKQLFEVFPGSRVHTLFNTHWHPEQTGSNARLADAGARILAHENTRLWLTREISRPGEDRVYEPLPAKARPSETFYTGGAMPFADSEIAYGYMLQAHTDGDIYVHFRNHNVLAAGGAVTADAWPFVDWWTGGWIFGLVDGLDRLLEAADEDTRIVPATGPMLSRADLVAQREMYAVIAERLLNLLTSSMSPNEAVAAKPAREFEGQWGNSDVFVKQAFESLWGHFSPDA